MAACQSDKPRYMAAKKSERAKKDWSSRVIDLSRGSSAGADDKEGTQGGLTYGHGRYSVELVASSTNILKQFSKSKRVSRPSKITFQRRDMASHSARRTKNCFASSSRSI